MVIHAFQSLTACKPMGLWITNHYIKPHTFHQYHMTEGGWLTKYTCSKYLRHVGEQKLCIIIITINWDNQTIVLSCRQQDRCSESPVTTSLMEHHHKHYTTIIPLPVDPVVKVNKHITTQRARHNKYQLK